MKNDLIGSALSWCGGLIVGATIIGLLLAHRVQTSYNRGLADCDSTHKANLLKTAIETRFTIGDLVIKCSAYQDTVRQLREDCWKREWKQITFHYPFR
jgi:hypothetical protein